ncbi:hypothetical protein [Streptomyces sp. VRA16 Mangrove soil]|nr:hypothetical protein [Streptomyces sp. VRA16 Mangrove soil]MBO1332245.1 hypothetical protein [Streptomyces sp. VRA16 Mangrove soil]
MRHLTEQFLLGALHRGRTVEQFLGPCGGPDRPKVAYVEIRPAEGRFEV